MSATISLDKYSDLLSLQERINFTLKGLYESNKSIGRDKLGELLIDEVEKLVDTLNSEGYSFGRSSYGADINFENSEQSYSDGKEMGGGVTLNFTGFTCQVIWNSRD